MYNVFAESLAVESQRKEFSLLMSSAVLPRPAATAGLALVLAGLHCLS